MGAHFRLLKHGRAHSHAHTHTKMLMRSGRLVITGKTYLSANTRFIVHHCGDKAPLNLVCVGEDLNAPPLGLAKRYLCLTLFMHACELMCVPMFVFAGCK